MRLDVIDEFRLEHELQAVIKDAAGNATTAGPNTIMIDCTLPGPRRDNFKPLSL